MILSDRSIICQNCGEKIITVGKTVRLIIPNMNYECTCGSRGVLEMITVIPLPEILKGGGLKCHY